MTSRRSFLRTLGLGLVAAPLMVKTAMREPIKSAWGKMVQHVRWPIGTTTRFIQRHQAGVALMEGQAVCLGDDGLVYPVADPRAHGVVGYWTHYPSHHA